MATWSDGDFKRSVCGKYSGGVTKSCPSYTWKFPGDGNIIKCTDNNKIYRFNNGDKKLYLIDDTNIRNQYGITSFWGANGGNSDCRDGNWGSQTTEANRLIFKPTTPVTFAPEGQSVKCYERDQNGVYRWTNGKLLGYPKPEVASTWDSNWGANYKGYDCGSIQPSGSMENKPTDGKTIKCGNDLYKYAYNENKLYKYENQAIAQQYGGTLPTTSSNCDQYINTGNVFNWWQTMPDNVPEGQLLKCMDKGGGVYRWTNGKLILVPNPEVASTWDSNWMNNYKAYNCGSKPISSGVMESKINTDGKTIKCGNEFYRHNLAENKLYKYENQAIAQQYGGTLPTTSNNCELYINSGNVFNSWQTMPDNVPEGQLLKCMDKNAGTVYRWTNGKLIGVPNPEVASTWDSNWMNNYKAYNCGSKPIATGVLETRPSDGVPIRCTGSKIYKYDKANNSISFFPNISTFKQYNPNWNETANPIIDRNCEQYVLNQTGFTSTTRLSRSATDGESVVCNESNVNSASANIYRYNKTKDALFSYNNNTIATGWNPNWMNYKSYTCDSRYNSNTANLPQKPANNEVIKCENVDGFHLYNAEQNTISRYATVADLMAKNPNAINSTNPKTINCSYFVKWPLEDYDVLSCNEAHNIYPTDFYYYKSGSGNNKGTVTKYANQNDAAQKELLKGWVGSNPYTYYNCNVSFNIANSTETIPNKSDIIKCNNKTDVKSYSKVNVNGQNLPAINPVNSSSQYFKFNSGNSKFERYGNDSILSSYDLNTAKTMSDCYMLNKTDSDTAIVYNNPPNKKIIQCTNQINNPFPYYLYDSSKNILNPFPARNVAERYDPSYITNAANYNCSYINASFGLPLNYSPPGAGSVINCSNEASNTYPKYFYDGNTSRLNKYQNSHVFNSWNIQEPPNNTYDCNYLPIQKGPDKGYKQPLDGSNINCSNKTDVPFPYYKYNSSSNILSRYKDITALFTWSPDNANINTSTITGIPSLDCRYLTNVSFSNTLIENRALANSTDIYCSDKNNVPPQLYKYSDQLIRPYTKDTIASWNASVQNVTNCNQFIEGPPMYNKSMEDNYSFTMNPFLKINRNDTISYFMLDNTNGECNSMPQNYSLLTNSPTDYDKYYSRDKYVELYSDDTCTTRASNDANVSYNKNSSFNVGTLKYSEGQNSLYYKLTTKNR
jgi:hypothetical protein